MAQFIENLLTASLHGSIVILAVILLRLALRKTPKKYICLLWLLAGIRLLMPIEIRSDLSLQPEFALPAHIHWPVVLLLAWGVVACLFGIYSVASYLKLKNQVREAVRIRGGWECDKIDTAFILGFIKPRIYIPMGMNRQVQKHILEHERTHLDKGDHWIKMIGFLALALHWFNPLVWVAYILLCRDIEMACDERVVQFMELEERKSYSAALIACSSRQRHVSANPVAFGEVNVKQRILSILKYQKPGFWISLLGVVAFFFVAVCLVTSPPEVVEPVIVEVPATEAATEVPTEETREPSTFAANLKQEDIVAVCTDAINQLIEQESCLIQCEYSVFYPERDQGDHYESYSIFRRYGNDKLTLVYDAPEMEKCTIGSSVLFGDMYGSHFGDFWVNEGSRAERQVEDINEWLNRYSPEGDEVFFPEGTGVISEDSVAFRMAWCEEGFWRMEEYEGTFTFRFNNDGSVEEIYGEYEEILTPDDSEEDKRYYKEKLVVLEEEPAETYSVIADYAGQCIPVGQLETVRREQKKITEIPSNKTDYDRDYGLGSASMRWYYFDEEWQFAYGAENATATGLTLTYFESGEGHKSLTAGEGFWLEELVDGRWTVLEPASPVTASEETIAVSWAGRDAVTVNWADSYGTLERGYYRIGRYHTVVMNDGRTETNHCYAKFRVYDPNHEQLLQEARSAVNTLLETDNYHLYNFNWMTENDYEYYLSDEVWKNGKDYLSVTRYPSRKDLSIMTNVRGSMWRDGKYYSLSWEEEPALSGVTEWSGCVDGYQDDTNFSMWSWDFEWYDADVEEVYKDGNNIHILSAYDYDDKYEVSEITLTIDNSGNLKGLVKAYLPRRNCTLEEKMIDKELVVFDTSKVEIASLIAAQDIDTPMAFCYEEDVKNNPDAQKTGFKNKSKKTVATPDDAIALADKESTMPPLMEFQTGYCQYKTYHDDEAGMWKVDMFWWQHDTMQTVYMTDDGVTKMIVSVE